MSKKAFTLLFFLSGLCGLIYQILWTRLLSFILGNTYVAISIIVASFLVGLFAGAWLIGIYMHRCRNELRWYAFLEFIIGGYALLILAGYGLTESVFLALNAAMGELNLLHLAGKFFLTALLIFPPTAAMGATLPLVIQYFTKNKQAFMENISFFYAINTLGGAVGVFCAGFFIIEILGVREGIICTALLNMAIGLIIVLQLRKSPPETVGKTAVTAKKPEKSIPKKKQKAAAPYDRFLYLSAAGFAGFAALSYEIIWTRGLKFLIHNTTYSFSIILVTFLVGIAVGSLLMPRIRKWKISEHFLYGILQVALGLFAIMTIYLFYDFSNSTFFQEYFVKIIYDYAYHWIWGIVIFVVICSMMFLIPAIIMGVLFPLINDIYFRHTDAKAGKTVSAIYAVNTLFSILGSLASGFILLPQFGIKTAILIISVINFALGIVFIWKSEYKRLPAFAVSSLLLIVIIASTASGSDYLLGRGERQQDRVLYYKEGAVATVKVFERQRARYMNIDGITIASTSRSLLQKEKLIGHLPFFFNESIQDVLSVGLASGISVGSMSLHPSVKKIDCVELIDPVFTAARSFRQYNYDIFSNPKINLIKNDIYAYLKYTDQKYDLISSDGKLGSLYSGNTIMLAQDYFELCKEKLTDDGLFIHWIPIITPSRALKVITDTLKKSFKYVAMFYFYSSDIFMISSNSPIKFDHAYMDQVLRNETVNKDIRPFYIKNGLSIISAFTGFYEEPLTGNTRLNTFNKPILEFEYLRDWKKSKQIPGGYRAKNMDFLTKNFEKADINRLVSTMPGIAKDVYGKNIYSPSLNFFRFNTRNFHSGNFQAGLKAYVQWKNMLQLNETASSP